MKPILEIKNISKKFRISHDSSPYLSIRDSISGIFKRKTGSTEDFYALDGVSLEIERGDTVGIIGKNGAGKSTLLKILSKITPPTSGSIACRGRMASLLEVGTGFHPELTGRENIFFNGSILGMKRKEIEKNFDAIVDFSGCEKFLDTPLKHYSSGMQLRLAFAVSAFLENEILIIDEVLAVGDAEFQKKCLGKMEDVSRSGRTILFVSHNMNVINSLCKKSAYLSKGKLISYGNTQTVMNEYLSLEAGMKSAVEFTAENYPGDKIARLISARIIDDKGNTLESSEIDKTIGVEFQYQILQAGYQSIPNLHVFNFKGEVAFFSIEQNGSFGMQPGLYKSVLWIPGNTFNTGKYFFGPALSNLNPLIIHFFEKEALVIDIFEDISKRETVYKDPIPGILRPKTEWSTIKLN